MALPCRRLASGSKDSSVRVWDAQTRRCLFAMGSHTKAVSAVRWTGDGHIISAARDCAIFVWDAQACTMSWATLACTRPCAVSVAPAQAEDVPWPHYASFRQ